MLKRIKDMRHTRVSAGDDVRALRHVVIPEKKSQESQEEIR